MFCWRIIHCSRIPLYKFHKALFHSAHFHLYNYRRPARKSTITLFHAVCIMSVCKLFILPGFLLVMLKCIVTCVSYFVFHQGLLTVRQVNWAPQSSLNKEMFLVQFHMSDFVYLFGLYILHIVQTNSPHKTSTAAAPGNTIGLHVQWCSCTHVGGDSWMHLFLPLESPPLLWTRSHLSWLNVTQTHKQVYSE